MENEYRKSYCFNGGDDFWYIEKKRSNGKWYFCFAVDSFAEGEEWLKNPEKIEKALKKYRITGIIMGIFTAGFIIYEILTN